MATIKVVLRKKINKDGTYPLAIRITKDRKTSFIHLGYHLKPEDWIETEQRVKSSHPNSRRLNNFILTRIAEASNTSLEIETNKKEVSVQAIRQKIKPQGGNNFFTQANLYLKKSKDSGSYNSYLADTSRLKLFKEYLNGFDLPFHEITPSLLEKFKSHLKSERKCSERTITNYMMVIRSVFSFAIREGVTEEKYYPFGKKKITIKIPESTKIGLSAEDVTNLETIVLDDSSQDHARNLWLISFYFAGMRISDVLRLKWSDFQNGRLHYTMGKNNKYGSLKIPDKAQIILAKYDHLKTSNTDLVFPDLKSLSDLNNTFEVKKKIVLAVNLCNKKLKKYVAPAAKINGKLTTHIARHTFATLAGDKVPLQMLQKLYRHSDIRTTIGYQSAFFYKDADDALEAVIGI